MSFGETAEEETRGRWTQTGGTRPRTKEHPEPPDAEEGRKDALLAKSLGRERGPAHAATADFWPPDGARTNPWCFTPPSLWPFVAIAPGKLTQLTSVGAASRQTNSSCHAPALTAHPGKDPHGGERSQKPVSPEPPGQRCSSWSSRCGRQSVLAQQRAQTLRV